MIDKLSFFRQKMPHISSLSAVWICCLSLSYVIEVCRLIRNENWSLFHCIINISLCVFLLTTRNKGLKSLGRWPQVQVPLSTQKRCVWFVFKTNVKEVPLLKILTIIYILHLFKIVLVIVWNHKELQSFFSFLTIYTVCLLMKLLILEMWFHKLTTVWHTAGLRV